MSGKPLVLVDPRGVGSMLADQFELTGAPREEIERAAWLRDVVPNVTAALAIGGRGLPGDIMAAAKSLNLISCFGAGYDKFDPAALRARGVTLTNCPSINHEDVADVAMGLLISVARGIADGDRRVRAGQFRTGGARTARLRGRKLGIVGLGAIGLAVALRAKPFGLDIAWTGPHPKPDAPYTYMADLHALATWADILCVCTRADASTAQLIDATVIAALGPRGILINISRGSVVDEDALIAALKSGALGGAGLDVFAEEPTPPARWADVPNTTLTPHFAGATPESMAESAAFVTENLRRHFAGEPVAGVVN